MPTEKKDPAIAVLDYFGRAPIEAAETVFALVKERMRDRRKERMEDLEDEVAAAPAKIKKKPASKKPKQVDLPGTTAESEQV